MHAIEIELEQRILILDGAMGTMIQTYGLTEKDYRNESLKNNLIDLKGNFEILNLVRPEIISTGSFFINFSVLALTPALIFSILVP
jgi:methionine synthase I (cobalamin-dependent)